MSSFDTQHAGPRPDDRDHMVKAMGLSSVDELLAGALPDLPRAEDLPVLLPPPVTDEAALAELRALASANTPMTSMIGLGFHNTVTPAALRRNILENPSWYTAYTPYQAEISQGRLEALLVFQTVIADLTGLPLAGASLLDEPTAAAEAMAMARRVSKSRSTVYLVDVNTLPQTLAVLTTRARPQGIEVALIDPDDPNATSIPHFGLHLQYPGTDGIARDPSALITASHQAGALVTVASDPLACLLLREPGALGADLAVGSAQRLGVPPALGGPHAGFLAARSGLERNLPGRLVGVSRDASGNPAHRLALQTREQHIRRQRATSNICTAQALVAIVAGMYAVYHGPEGLREIATRIATRAATLASALAASGIPLVEGTRFDTVTAIVRGQADAVLARAVDRGINLRRVDADHVAITCDETTTPEHLRRVVAALHPSGTAHGRQPTDLREARPTIAGHLRRHAEYLRAPVFSQYRSQTAITRYLRRLADRDYALDRGMIPLGSCTMKLNPSAALEPLTWPEFASAHPNAPADQIPGYARIISDLEAWLADLTGYDAVSLQPNAGSQGELAGLLAIGAHHANQGQRHRTTCLIPTSAHGTNAASAAMAGLTVVSLACDSNGDVDLDDLDRNLAAHRDDLAAIMLTYPSTHGVYESTVAEICRRVHDAGGQVYIDGANLNALLGHVRLADLGADVSHLNLHKTFGLPHGGGGPGIGPVAVRSHLAPYLPGDPQRVDSGAVSGTRYGSAGLLPVAWMYLRTLGAEGVADATGGAVLAANYVATRLREAYPILYTGRTGLVAHECVLDVRPLTRATGVTVDDVAKRLIDYGFHAPTVSFPVAGTLMVEPTESEDLAELDRFCDAMLAIRAEIDTVGRGDWPAADNPLANAPHTARMVISDDWDHPYSRALAAYPPGVDPDTKYWPPVRRVDGAHGDRRLVTRMPG